MTHLVLELCATPALIGIASLAARRFGQAVGGWFVALPLTSGPLLFFVALEHGHRFAAATAVGALGGGGAEVGFCLGYRVLARRGRWLALAAGSLVYAGAATAIRLLPLGPGLPVPLLPLLAGVLAAIAVGLFVLRAARFEPGERRLPSRWDVPLRMAAGTGAVVVLTEVAPTLGPRVAGLLVTYPLLTAILAVSAHRFDGPRGASEVLRGLLLGLTALAAFLGAVVILLPRIGLAAFAVAVAAALIMQVLTLSSVRRATT